MAYINGKEIFFTAMGSSGGGGIETYTNITPSTFDWAALASNSTDYTSKFVHLEFAEGCGLDCMGAGYEPYYTKSIDALISLNYVGMGCYDMVWVFAWNNELYKYSIASVGEYGNTVPDVITSVTAI